MKEQAVIQDTHSTVPQYTGATTKYQSQSPLPVSLISLIFLGLASSLLYIKLRTIGDLTQQIPEFVIVSLTLSILYLVACLVSRNSTSPCLVYLILGFSATFRIILLGSNPSLSDDVYRYQWEGYLQTQGVNPYRFAPDAPQLERYRNESWRKVNNKNASAIYPPMMQMVHTVIYSIQGSTWFYKLAFLLVEAGLIFVLLQLLAMNGIRRERIVYYAWNPLTVVEIAGNGHHDVVVVSFVVLSIVLISKGKQVASLLTYAAAVLSKFYPALGLPFLLKRVSSRRWFWLPVALLVAYLPYLSAGRHVFDSLIFYSDKWRFNGFLFKLLVQVFQDDTIVQRVLTLGGLLMLLWIFLKLEDLLEQIYWMTALVLLCSPTLFPWYLIWVVPFFCFFPSASWLLLTCLSCLSYQVLIRWWTLGLWQPDELYLKLQYYPFYGMLVIDAMRRFLGRKNSTAIKERLGN